MEQRENPPIQLTQKHLRERFWQIWFPIILGAVIIIAVEMVVIFSTGTGDARLTDWSNLSTILLVLLTSFPLFLLIAFTGLMIFLMVKLLKVTPRGTRKLQGFFHLIQLFVKSKSDQIIKPVVIIQSRKTAWQTFWKQIGMIFHRKSA